MACNFELAVNKMNLHGEVSFELDLDIFDYDFVVLHNSYTDTMWSLWKLYKPGCSALAALGRY